MITVPITITYRTRAGTIGKSIELLPPVLAMKRCADLVEWEWTQRVECPDLGIDQPGDLAYTPA